MGNRRSKRSIDNQIAKAVRYLSPILDQNVRETPTATLKHRQLLTRATHWFRGGNLVGIAVGVKYTNGIPDINGTPCLKFYVRRKLAKGRMRKSEIIPAFVEIDELNAGFSSDIDALDEIPKAHIDSRFRPVMPGAALGNFRGTRGTTGIVVRRVLNGVPSPKMLLTCAHVVCPFDFRVEDPVEQPPDPDRAVGPNRIGRLTPFFTSLQDAGPKMADAALVELDPQNQDANNNIPGIGLPTGFARVRELNLQQLRSLALVRTGASTGARVPGVIESVDGAFHLQFTELGGRTVIFNSVMLYRTTAREGDSGAAVINAADNQIVGLHIGGGSGMGVMIAMDTIIPVLENIQPRGQIVLAN